jgi:signal transduction histidine kinase
MISLLLDSLDRGEGSIMHYYNFSDTIISADASGAAHGSQFGSDLPALELTSTAPSTEQLKVEIFEYISHELRSPLTSIMCTLALLAEGAFGDLDQAARVSILKASNSSKRLLNLVNEMLDIQRKSHEELLKFTQTQVSEVLEVSASEVAGLAAEKRQLIIVEAPAVEAKLDPDRIGQVLINLLSNAIKVSPVGSTITVRALLAGNSLEFDVIDQGNGIPSTLAARLFTKYGRAIQDKNGSGLGLLISKGIVAAHGGTIGAENLPQGNARFWFRIPLNGSVQSTAASNGC